MGKSVGTVVGSNVGNNVGTSAMMKSELYAAYPTEVLHCTRTFMVLPQSLIGLVHEYEPPAALYEVAKIERKVPWLSYR